MVKRISDVDVSKIDKGEIFFVDTNVLLAVHFGFSRDWSAHKIDTYASFILALLKKDVVVCVSALNLQELYHLVEKCECSLYGATHGDIHLKRYRRMTSERSRIARDVKSKHLEISEQYSIVPSLIDADMIEDFIDEYESHSYDPIDFFTARHNGKGCVNFITDDGDFRRDSSINVYCQ